MSVSLTRNLQIRAREVDVLFLLLLSIYISSLAGPPTFAQISQLGLTLFKYSNGYSDFVCLSAGESSKLRIDRSMFFVLSSWVYISAGLLLLLKYLNSGSSFSNTQNIRQGMHVFLPASLQKYSGETLMFSVFCSWVFEASMGHLYLLKYLILILNYLNIQKLKSMAWCLCPCLWVFKYT